jgi:SAM-dependent methyltransferase
MDKEKYKNYFLTQYKTGFSKNRVVLYRNWFYPQWKKLMKIVKIKKDTKILEIGAGMGALYSYLTEIGLNSYTGLELDSDAVRFCNNYFKTKSFQNLSFEEFTTTRKYDYVFAFEVLEHLSDPEQCIDKIFHQLKEKGQFVGTSPYPYIKNIRADKTHKYVLHPENWRRLFLQAGFSKVEVVPMSFLPYLWRINKKLNVPIPFYVPLNNFISTTFIIANK